MTRVRAVVLAALLLALSACSTVPMSSPTVQITQAPGRPAEVVGIEPLPPEPGATPEEIVRSFIDAAASVRPGHPVAREHLAPDAQRIPVGERHGGQRRDAVHPIHRNG